MSTTLAIGLSNAAAVAILAPLVALVSRGLKGRPALVHGLWVLVLLKLVTPPLFTIPIGPASPGDSGARSDEPTPDEVVGGEAVVGRMGVGTSAIPRPSPRFDRPLSSSSPSTKRTDLKVDLSASIIVDPTGASDDPGADDPSVLEPSTGDSVPSISDLRIPTIVDLATSDPAGADPSADELATINPGAPAISRVDPPPLSSSPLAGEGWGGGSARPSASNPPQATPSTWLARHWPSFLGALWLAGSLAWAIAAARRIGRLRSLLRATGPPSSEVVGRVEALSHRLGLRRPPQVTTVAGPVGPFVWALGGRPRLVLPIDLWTRLEPEGRDALLLHELAHLRRGDHRVRWLEALATGLYWWHPALWWARRGLHEAEEACCDAWVVWARPESARSYASAILDTFEFLSAASTTRPGPLPLGASGLGRVESLSERITRIMKGKTPKSLSLLGGFALIVAALLFLPWLPTWGRPSPSPRPQIPPPHPSIVDTPMARRILDEIEIYEVQIELKQAYVTKVETQHALATAKADQIETLYKKNVVSEAEVANARAEADIAASDVAIAKAELREVELLWKQARRRLVDEVGPDSARAREGRGEAVDLPPTGPATDTPTAVDAPSETRKLKQIGLAFHNYEAANGHFPPPAILGPDGTPLLSWRVAILPYLEGEARDLYDRFKFDEPWDGPNNWGLLAEMPDVFRSGRGSEQGETDLLAPVGPETFWGDPEGMRIAPITDGTSNTIALVSSGRSEPWTRPGDLDYPSSGEFRRFYEEGGTALFVDGSIRKLRPTDPATFHALFTKAGGEVIDSSRLEPDGARADYLPPPTASAEQAGFGGAEMRGMMGAPGSGVSTMSGMMSGRAMGAGDEMAVMGGGGVGGGGVPGMGMGGIGMTSSAPSSPIQARIDEAIAELSALAGEMADEEVRAEAESYDVMISDSDPDAMPSDAIQQLASQIGHPATDAEMPIYLWVYNLGDDREDSLRWVARAIVARHREGSGQDGDRAP